MAKETTVSSKDIDAKLKELLGDAQGEDDQLRALHRGIKGALDLPMPVVVAASPMLLVSVHYDGNPRRGLTARCRRGNGPEFSVGLIEAQTGPSSTGFLYLAVYGRWVGLAPAGIKSKSPGALKTPIQRTTANGSHLRLVMPADAGPQSKTSPARAPAAVAERPQLGLSEFGEWDPADEYWGEEGEPIADWAKPIIARGPRPLFEMERVWPLRVPGDFESDRIGEAIHRHSMGDAAGARKILNEVINDDKRCLDAYAHLGIVEFDRNLKKALAHYELGVQIGELTLGSEFDGVLSWGLVDNRPYLRCLHGYGLCLWRLKRWQEAERVFDRMLWLNPSDNQGVRFVLPRVRDRERWTSDVYD